MKDPDLRTAILQEMAKLRHELADLQNPNKPPLGPPDFLQRYTERLQARLAQLEQELQDAEASPD